MEREFNRENLQGVYRMFFELAKGNFAFQIKRTKHRDELEGLIALLNMTAERLNRNRNQFLWINRHNEVVIVRTVSFLINREMKVIDYNCKGGNLIEVADSKKIKEESFEKLLTPHSRQQWKECLQQLYKQNKNFACLELQYDLYNLLELHLSSVIAKVAFENDVKFAVTSYIIDTQKDEFFNFRENATMKKLSIWDQQLFQNIHEFILHHLEEPLKPIYELASLHNTNEHKVKTGFKMVFGSTPFKYHRGQRIEQSKILISNTDLSLSEIARKMGFVSYPVFSKTFKQVTTITPRQYGKLTRKS